MIDIQRSSVDKCNCVHNTSLIIRKLIDIFSGDFVNSKEYKKPEWVTRMEEIQKRLAGNEYLFSFKECFMMSHFINIITQNLISFSKFYIALNYSTSAIS